MSLESKVEYVTALDNLTDDERRDLKRRAVLWPAIVHIGSHEFKCQIRNFSMGGLKLKLDLPFRQGTMIKVEIPMRDIILSAEIAWQEGDYMGLRFHEDDDLIRGIFGERAVGMGIPKSTLHRGYRKK